MVSLRRVFFSYYKTKKSAQQNKQANSESYNSTLIQNDNLYIWKSLDKLTSLCTNSSSFFYTSHFKDSKKINQNSLFYENLSDSTLDRKNAALEMAIDIYYKNLNTNLPKKGCFVNKSKCDGTAYLSSLPVQKEKKLPFYKKVIIKNKKKQRKNYAEYHNFLISKEAFPYPKENKIIREKNDSFHNVLSKKQNCSQENRKLEKSNYVLQKMPLKSCMKNQNQINNRKKRVLFSEICHYRELNKTDLPNRLKAENKIKVNFNETYRREAFKYMEIVY